MIVIVSGRMKSLVKEHAIQRVSTGEEGGYRTAHSGRACSPSDR
ncbi:hypothetical protein ASZ90_013135 [hydrocarbon metagenome]|uniref:Uncharacterized protein n=1 Tax=hydrocarbon metagenome TaxID=938273 RepID=A0A0W8F8F2_9ZZZZ